MICKLGHYKNFVFSIVFLPLASFSGEICALTLPEVEQMALHSSPEISQLENKANSLREKAVAAGQLADPKLQAGIINIPTDSFSFTQENMTQILVGVSQSFPKGRSLSIKSRQVELLSLAEEYKSQNISAEILKTVRNEWVDIYYWCQAAKIIEENRVIFEHLVKVTESMLATGKNYQHDVFHAKLELSQIENRIIIIAEELRTTRVQLARWIGECMANKAAPIRLPEWPSLLNEKVLVQCICQHPQLKADAANTEANFQGVKLAEQQYKSGWTLAINYSFREGNNPVMGGKRSDFIGAQVSLDLPIFTTNRQDKEVAASLDTLNADKDTEVSDLRKLVSEVEQNYVLWRKLSKQIELYQQQLIPEAEQYAKSSLIAYQNDQADFLTVIRAYVSKLNIQLENLKIQVDHNKTRIALLYLEGDTS